ncbi:hypothetical protein FA13DRAFT_972718 [Coprinellus micaceus]|uniref:Uncharacterized protein n=1 Tax=Coprinellus micaceus TaxID=71717 RepID=A0A4Y7T0J9_COPMI|nr:hypothetical protein FA13DRAFT_972718 [Coprinellus micaceus]
MLVKPSHFVLTATIALSAATTGLARSHSHSRPSDLEQRAYDILDAYEHSARGFGAFDDGEELDARDSDPSSSELERREELISELAARFRDVLDKRSPIIDSHGYKHAWRNQEPLQKRSIFPHNEAMISSIQNRLRNRRSKEKARKAAAAKLRQEALEEVERREALEDILIAARELAGDEELCCKRGV